MRIFAICILLLTVREGQSLASLAVDTPAPIVVAISPPVISTSPSGAYTVSWSGDLKDPVLEVMQQDGGVMRLHYPPLALAREHLGLANFHQRRLRWVDDRYLIGTFSGDGLSIIDAKRKTFEVNHVFETLVENPRYGEWCAIKLRPVPRHGPWNPLNHKDTLLLVSLPENGRSFFQSLSLNALVVTPPRYSRSGQRIGLFALRDGKVLFIEVGRKPLRVIATEKAKIPPPKDPSNITNALIKRLEEYVRRLR